MSRASSWTPVLAVLALGLAAACSGAGSGSAADDKSDPAVTEPEPIVAEAPATSAQLEPAVSDIACDGLASWNTTGQEDGFPDVFSGAVVADVVPTRGSACEEIRFVLSGPHAAGYRIEYGRAWNDEDGTTVDVAGDATLVVILNAEPPNGDRSVELGLRAGVFRDWGSLRELNHPSPTDGGSVWAVGVQDKRPFRAYAEAGPGNAWTLVLQVAT